MSDNTRELLELAARAAGLAIDKSETNGGGRGNDGFDLSGNAVLDWHNGTTWNPLTDDGDALRLALKLRLGIGMDDAVCCAGIPRTGRLVVVEKADHAGDEESAMRMCIVRAAAEIGKDMSGE